ncbi:hypothetical protein BH582_23875 [Vibrio sp. 10N.222.47.A9]|uniref:hypothetical protein n=1 Tax=Vibrio sp. 10N.222.47.A9 TaxID=1903178 RepID=UPI00097588AE|nr:hypothetical protein [Vibrio sp. 10N.222.47.A9]OMO23506.1 hypothetical protein BH582_23875 [Vibrio sp. 10N.222.47.A9]
MKHVFKKIMAGSLLLLAFIFSLTVHAEEVDFYNVKIESLSAAYSTSSEQTTYYITWSNGQCRGHSSESMMMSMLKTAYILNMNIKHLKSGCYDGNVVTLDM